LNNNETLEKMSQMRLSGMKSQYELILSTRQSSELTNDEFLSILIESEYEDRINRRTKRYIKAAKFRYQASIAEIDFHSQRNLDKTKIIRLASCDFIKKGESLIITGPTGSGKSYITFALGNQACMKGYKVLYYNMNKLFSMLKMQKADNTDVKEKAKIAKHDLLILDDFGLKHLDTANRFALLEIIEDRHSLKSTIITSQLPVSEWHNVIGDATIADAILDRIVHTAHRVELNGSSMRKVQSRKLQEE
jgi:DNA replication protein DnaC